MFHHGDDALHAGDQVHCAAGTFDHFPRNHPVCDIAVVRDLERSKDREIDMTAADLRERIRAREKGRARSCRDRLFAGVDEIGIFFAGFWKWADA